MDNIPDKVIPVIIQDCQPDQLHLLLRTIQNTDFRSNYETARNKLLQRWGYAKLERETAADQTADSIAANSDRWMGRLILIIMLAALALSIALPIIAAFREDDPTPAPAPVDVITILIAAERPLR